MVPELPTVTRVQAFAAYDSGALVRWGPTSTGRREMPTPARLFHTNWKARQRTSTFKVTVGNHGNCPVRGIEIRLTEGGSKTQVVKIKSLLPRESVEKSFPATGNPGEVKVDVAVPTVGGETNADNNHYTYHVIFQSA